MNKSIKPLLALLMTLILFSLVAVIARGIVSSTSAIFLLFLRMAIAFLAFLPFILHSRVWKKKGFGHLIAVSSLASINLSFFMWGIQYTTASASQLLYATMPILTIIVQKFFQKKHIPLRVIFGVLIGLFGIIFIMYQSSAEKGQTITGGLVGNLAIGIAMLGWFSYIMLSKKLSEKFTAIEIGGTSVFVSFAVSIVLLLIEISTTHVSLNITMPIFLGAFYLGFLGTFLTYILLQYAIKRLSSLTVNIGTYIQPVFTITIASIFLGEKMNLSFFIGILLVFAGVFLTVTLDLFAKRKKAD